MSETLLEVLDRYDLKDKADVEACAQDLGRRWASAIAALAAATDEELRGALFGYFFAAPFGAMAAAIGVENARKVAQVLLEAAAQVAEAKARTRH